jgi:D-3-phosphoglycerate dehydrogenase
MHIPSQPALPKVLAAEKLSPDGLVLLRNGVDVHEKKGLSHEELLSVIPEYEALLVRSETKVTASLLQAAKKLKVVARAGVGVDNIGEYSLNNLTILNYALVTHFPKSRC